MQVLVAGATGALGQKVVQTLLAEGHMVRVLTRSASRAPAGVEVVEGDALKPDTLRGVCDGVDVVFSSLGQSVGPETNNLRPGYEAVDYVGNHALLEVARTAGVRRFVYVSVFGAENFPRVAYLAAHTRVAAEVRSSGLGWGIIQPTGFFSAYRAFFDMAVSGRAWVFGSGEARTNPIHDLDLARVCVQAIGDEENLDYPVGGPVTYSRRQVAEVAFAALGRPARISSSPAWMPGLMGTLLRPFAPRMAELLDFFGVVGASDFVAPAVGTLTLEQFYGELARQLKT